MNALKDLGYEIVEDIYTAAEVEEILALIDAAELENSFGVREFLKNNPEMIDKVFNENLRKVLHRLSPDCNKSIKSIYFDKPPSANWVVNWHQDLTINLRSKKSTDGIKNWRVTNDRTVVQPDRKLLEKIFTIRIHLDDCNKDNGALRVIEKSHKNGVVEIKEWVRSKEGKERVCEVKKGGILVMRPLLLHSSRRTENQKNRRIIHIEFTDAELPNGLEWKEKIEFSPFV